MKMDLIGSVISRVESFTYPIIHDEIGNSVRAMLGPQMANLGTTFSPLGEMILFEAISSRFKEALVREHEPAGVNAALTVGENMVQSSLSSHHYAGLKRGATGFDRIEEITNLSNKVDIARIVLRPVGGKPRSKEEVNELANGMARVEMAHIVTRYEVMSAPEGDIPLLERMEPWYTVFLAISGTPTQSISSRWLRLHLDPYLMFKRRISLPDIANNISAIPISASSDQGTIRSAGVVAYPPVSYGGHGNWYIDVHIRNDRDIGSIYGRLASIMSIQIDGFPTVESATALYDNLLTDLRVSAIGTSDTMGDEIEVASVAPAFIPPEAWSTLIKAMIPSATMLPGNGRRFYSGLTSENGELLTGRGNINEVRRLMLEVPIFYADLLITPNRELENGASTITLDFRRDLVNSFPYLERANLESITFHDVNGGPTAAQQAERFLLLPAMELHHYWYIEAVMRKDGPKKESKIEDILALPEVDASRSYTTSHKDLMMSVGYLAMRQMLYQEFIANIKVDPIHAKIIINNMTLYKIPIALKRNAIKNDKTQWLTYGSFEEVFKYLTYSIWCGESDDLTSVSGRILTGQEIQIGAGGSRLLAGNAFVNLKNKRDAERRRNGS